MPQDWTNDLQPTRAVKNIRTDMTGDWYRDPWGWPEYDFLLPDHLDWFVRRAGASGIRHVAKIDVPKENFGIRPAIIMEPLDRLLYQSLVDSISLDLMGSLPSWTFGWRLSRRSPKPGLYAAQDREWARYRDHLKISSLWLECGLKTDIVSCFASISIPRLCGDIERRAANTGISNRLTDMLTAFDHVPGRNGLPQRSMASAALANMYLQRLDDAIHEYAATAVYPSGLVGLSRDNLAVRWMDDFWAFGDDAGLLRSFQMNLQELARRAGLELNLGKTAVYTDEDLWSSVAKIEHSAIDASIELTPPDVQPLESLIDLLIKSPETSRVIQAVA